MSNEEMWISYLHSYIPVIRRFIFPSRISDLKLTQLLSIIAFGLRLVIFPNFNLLAQVPPIAISVVCYLFNIFR